MGKGLATKKTGGASGSAEAMDVEDPVEMETEEKKRRSILSRKQVYR